MAVAATDLRSWTTQGAQDAAARTYASVKVALERSVPLQELDYEVFLQGSYANATNTRGDSDVDIVAMLTSTYMPDTHRLSTQEKARYEAARIPGTTSLSTFRRLVEDALVTYYGPARVHPKNKCIRIDRRDGYVDADVVPSLQHRLFTRYPAYGEPRFIEGISIQPLSRGSRIVNFPKEHIANGQRKNGTCSERYKPTVRQVKRFRRRAVDAGLLSKTDAPGYLLECLVYNVPDSRFIVDSAQRVGEVLSWFRNYSAEDLARTCMSCDEVHHLFRDDPGRHNEYIAKRVLDTLWGML